MTVFRTEAIVLRRTNYGEADRIIQLLTPKGKYSAMARGVRREKSKLAGAIELFGVCDVVMQEGKGDLAVLTSARLIHFYRHILENYDRMQFAYEVLKQIGKASEMVSEPEWYEVTAEILEALDRSSVSLELIQTWFYLRYAALLGHELSLVNDIDGHRLQSESHYSYDLHEKGFRLHLGGDISAGHIKLLRLMGAKPLLVVAQIGGIEPVIDECLSVTRQHAAV